MTQKGRISNGMVDFTSLACAKPSLNKIIAPVAHAVAPVSDFRQILEVVTTIASKGAYGANMRVLPQNRK